MNLGNLINWGLIAAGTMIVSDFAVKTFPQYPMAAKYGGGLVGALGVGMLVGSGKSNTVQAKV